MEHKETEVIGAFEAKTHFSQLLARAEHGEEIIITRRGQPVARLSPLTESHDREKAQQAAARLWSLGDTLSLGQYDWNEWKACRDEGRR